MKSDKRFASLQAAVFLLAGMATQSFGQGREPVLSLVKKEKPALLETLRGLVSIETGSRDREGLDKPADLIAARLKELGGTAELIESSAVYRMNGTPEEMRTM